MMTTTEKKMHVRKFRSRELAFQAANAQKGYAVILGDDMLFWVVSLRDAELLSRDGYDYAI